MSEVVELDPVIHAVVRLRITATLAGLASGDSLSFTRLQSILDVTPGNLTTHLRKLDDAGYVTIERSGSGRASRAVVALTASGRTAFADYTAALRSMIEID